MEKLNVKAAALAFGVTWAAGIFITGILAMLCNWGTGFVDLFADVYIGYAPTVLGSIIGAVWGFVDGAVCGLVLAWLYNKFSCCCCKKE